VNYILGLVSSPANLRKSIHAGRSMKQLHGEDFMYISIWQWRSQHGYYSSWEDAKACFILKLNLYNERRGIVLARKSVVDDRYLLLRWASDINFPTFTCELFRMPFSTSPWLQNLKWAEQTRINPHKCTCIVELSTVVWCWEYGNQLSVCEEFIAILNNLSIISHGRTF